MFPKEQSRRIKQHSVPAHHSVNIVRGHATVSSCIKSLKNMKTIQVTQGEIQDAMKKNIHRNKKKYYKKIKHKNKSS